VDYGPKRIGRLVDEAIALYRSSFRTLVVPGLYFLLPLTLTLSLVQSQASALMTRTVGRAVGQAGPVAPNAAFFAAFGVGYSAVLLAAALVGLGVLYYLSCLMQAAPALLERRRVPPKEFLKGGWRRFGWFLLAAWVSQMIAGFGYVFLFVPGLIILVFLSLVMPITVLEQASLPDALARSYSLVSGNFWRVVGFFASAFLIIYTLQSAFTSLALVPYVLSGYSAALAAAPNLPSLPWQVFIGVMQGLAYVIGIPLQGVCMLVLYLDLRSRREGMDLLMRAQRLAAAS
jgi:hypothetical protein